MSEALKVLLITECTSTYIPYSKIQCTCVYCVKRYCKCVCYVLCRPEGAGEEVEGGSSSNVQSDEGSAEGVGIWMKFEDFRKAFS